VYPFIIHANLSGTRVLAIITLLFSLPSSSLIVHLSDMQTMAKRSNIVAHGIVGEKRVVTDKFGRFITLTDVEVIDGLFGAKTSEVFTIYQVGGEKDGLVMPIMGGHIYQVGQEIIFFGLSLGDTFVSYGAGQGKLDISSTGGVESVREDFGNISAVRPDYKEYHPAPLEYDNKEILKSEIRLMLKDRVAP
jgi:hypothetical protein